MLAAIIGGVAVYDRVAARGGDIDRKTARTLPEVLLLGGFVGAHLVHVLFYHPELLRADPWVLLKVWAGISSIGGFAGAALAGAWLLRRRGQPVLPYADRVVVALTVGWIFGRLGCASAHDHPGHRTEFWLAVAFPDGARHDLGLYELLYALVVLLPLMLAITRRPWRTGLPTGWWLAAYGGARFGLDFLRAADRPFVDARYGGLTPAQYGALVMLTAGVLLLWRMRRYPGPLQPALWGRPERGGDRPAVPGVV